MVAQSRNPFTLRVGQLMTGFGAGCGLGIGVGYPIALGSVPIVGDVLSATSSAGSRAFGGVGEKAFGMLRKLGIKNLEAGVGCGVGIGHGFGIGIALKPGVSQQLFRSLQEKVSAVTSQLQSNLPGAVKDSPAETEKALSVNVLGNNLGKNSAGDKMVQEASGKKHSFAVSSANPVLDTETVQSAFEGKASLTGNDEELVGLQQENEILRTLLRHQELIEHLKFENEAIRDVLSEQFDMDPEKLLEPAKSGTVRRRHNIIKSSQHCFDCQMSARRRK